MAWGHGYRESREKVGDREKEQFEQELKYAVHNSCINAYCLILGSLETCPGLWGAFGDWLRNLE